jgi:hypothetical protein
VNKLIVVLLLSVSSFAATNPRFTSPSIYETQGAGYRSAGGDLNRDKRIDIIIVNRETKTLAVFLGKGDGTLAFKQTSPIPVGALSSGGEAVLVADFNNDAKADVVVATGLVGDDGGDVVFYAGKGDGTLQVGVQSDTQISPLAFATADFNDDKNLDLFVRGNGSSTLMLGHGDGTFSPTGFLPMTDTNGFGDAGFGVVAADFNKDGRVDVATANRAGVGVRFGNGDGTLADLQSYAPAYFWEHGFQMAYADFNKDGVSDLATTFAGTNALWMLYGRNDGTFAAGESYYAGVSPNRPVAADLNRDGYMDLVVGAYTSNEITILMGSPSGLVDHGSLPLSDGVVDLLATDLNGDMAADLAVTSLESGSLRLLLNELGVRMSVSGASKSIVGQSLTFTATLASGVPGAGNPTGLVGFYDNQSLKGKVQVSGGQASFTTNELAEGTHQITAVYWGNADFGQATARMATLVEAKVTPPCALSTASPSVTICEPSNGAYVPSPVRIKAGTTSSSKVSGMKIYVDGTTAYAVSNAATLDTLLNLMPGTHRLVVKAWNGAGQVFSATSFVNVIMQPCSVGQSSTPVVKVCAPTPGETVNSPVLVNAVAYDPLKPVTSMAVYVDYKLAHQANGSSLLVPLQIAPGGHRITVQSWNSAGTVTKSSFNVTVE